MDDCERIEKDLNRAFEKIINGANTMHEGIDIGGRAAVEMAVAIGRVDNNCKARIVVREIPKPDKPRDTNPDAAGITDHLVLRCMRCGRALLYERHGPLAVWVAPCKTGCGKASEFCDTNPDAAVAEAAQEAAGEPVHGQDVSEQAHRERLHELLQEQYSLKGQLAEVTAERDGLKKEVGHNEHAIWCHHAASEEYTEAIADLAKQLYAMTAERDALKAKFNAAMDSLILASKYAGHDIEHRSLPSLKECIADSKSRIDSHIADLRAM